MLQLGLSGYFIAFAVIGWVFLVSPISSALAGANQRRASILVVSWLLWTILVALLAYGSVKKWRWAFWAYLVLLTALVAAAISGPNTTSIALVSDIVTGGAGAVLLVASIVGLVRFGPWAMKKVSAPTEIAAPD
jgi:hypothetical protein